MLSNTKMRKLSIPIIKILTKLSTGRKQRPSLAIIRKTTTVLLPSWMYRRSSLSRSSQMRQRSEIRLVDYLMNIIMISKGESGN